MSKIEQYQIFGCAAEYGSFSKTAERLGVSNSHISKQMARLESALGYKLFHRSPHLLLTEAGETLQPYVRSMLESYNILEQTGSALKEDISGVVRLSVPPLLARELVIPELPRLMEEYPDLRVDLTVEQPTLQAFSDKQDIIITMGQLSDSSLICKSLGECPVVLVATPDYLAEKGEPKFPEDLKRHHCMASHFRLFNNAVPWVFHKDQQQFAVEIESRVAMNDIYGIKTLVKANMGIGVMLKFFVDDEIDTEKLIQVLPEYQFASRPPIYMVSRDRKLLPANVRVLKSFLTEVISRRLD
ncbi:LysR family transcriptional regulator [Endozoicomonas arenosclerae]|uniref:LysR family transcriptional regulator n=1 Tax=Endozoicomonas arenosclerae TaxID=1633495 RepID=UPI000785C72C|nr:LysR family transcriptional regulator [Endozoicomonas arenosclerae]